MTRTIDLNADLGEDETAEGIARDIAIMAIVSSCNIACGSHAGSFDTMQILLKAARANNVSAGAHPSYPDRQNFGRVSMDIGIADLRDSLVAQMDLISRAASQTGASLNHVKPHGALYNDAQDDPALADLLVQLCKNRKLPIVGMSGSTIHKYAEKRSVPFITEAFIDRRYTSHARLVPRSQKGAIITDIGDRISQGLALANAKPLATVDADDIIIKADTLCLHSDSDDALETARMMRNALEENGVTITAPER